MTALLPDAVRHSVESRSTFGASESFGVVALVLLLVLLIEWEVLRLRGAAGLRLAALGTLSLPLLVTVSLTIAARIQVLLN